MPQRIYRSMAKKAYVEQMGSGYLFSNGKKHYVIESEIYWGKFTVWTLPNIEGHHFKAAE